MSGAGQRGSALPACLPAPTLTRRAGLQQPPENLGGLGVVGVEQIARVLRACGDGGGRPIAAVRSVDSAECLRERCTTIPCPTARLPPCTLSPPRPPTSAACSLLPTLGTPGCTE